MNSKALLTAGGIGAAALAYIALLIFHYDVLSVYTVMFAILGAGLGIAAAYWFRFR